MPSARAHGRKGCNMLPRVSKLFTMLIECAFLLSLTPACESVQLAHSIPPENLTETRLDLAFERIQAYWNLHGKVPKEPSELPDMPDCSMRDGWGREFHWKSDGKRTVSVWSLGRDGKKGGSGEDEDMVITFEGKRKQQDDLPTIARRDMPD